MKKIISKFKKLLFYIFIGYPLYGLSFLIPRKKGRWVFGTGNKFFDNSKYLYLEVSDHPDIEAVWLTTSKELCSSLVKKGINAYYLHSVKGYYFLLTANIYVASYLANDHLPIWFIGRAKYINLWHGVGLKNMDFKSNMPQTYLSYHHPVLKYIYRPFRLLMYRKPDIFLSTSPYMTQHFQECFNLEDYRMVESLYPRCDIFSWDEHKLMQHISKVENENFLALIQKIKKYRISYIYMPTWRDSNPYYLRDSGVDFVQLNALMKHKNSVFILKLHPSTPIETLPNLSELENILVLDKDVDVYPLLPFISVLITDYSSIYYDFLLFQNKPTVFFTFDYENYSSNSRDLALPFFDYISGSIVHSFNELYTLLEMESFIMDKQKDCDLKEFFWGQSSNKLNLVTIIKTIDENRYEI